MSNVPEGFVERPRRNGDGTTIIMPIGKRFEAGNPGRPKGSRNKLAENFVDDLYQAWKTKGPEVIERVIESDPGKFMDIIAKIMPKEFTIKTETDELTDERLGLFLDLARRTLENRQSSGVGADQAAEGKPLIELQAISKTK